MSALTNDELSSGTASGDDTAPTSVTGTADHDLNSNLGIFNAEARSRTVYFAYGSNLWREQMKSRCPDSVYIGVARLPGWEWFINIRGYANIKKSPTGNHAVYGSVYLLSKSDEDSLDKSEGVPRSYKKITLDINLIQSPTRTSLPTLVYVDERQREGKAKEEYIVRMNKGIADSPKIPQEYIDTYLRKFIPAPAPEN